MKKIILLLTALVALCQVALSDENPVLPIIIRKGNDTIPLSRPRVPSRQTIECYYDGDALYFSFAYSEGPCVLTVTDNAALTDNDYIFDSSAPAAVNIGFLSDASLTISTALGNTYSGVIE